MKSSTIWKYGKLQQALKIIIYLYQLQWYQIFLEDICPLHSYIFLEYTISKMKCLKLLTVSITSYIILTNPMICYSTLISYRKLLALFIHNFFRTKLFVALKRICSISCFVARSTSMPFQWLYFPCLNFCSFSTFSCTRRPLLSRKWIKRISPVFPFAINFRYIHVLFSIFLRWSLLHFKLEICQFVNKIHVQYLDIRVACIV